MKRFNFNKPLVESPYPPQDTNVLWVDVEESTGKVQTISEFQNGKYSTILEQPSENKKVRVKVPDNEIWYKTFTGEIVDYSAEYTEHGDTLPDIANVKLIDHIADKDGYCKMIFDGPVEKILANRSPDGTTDSDSINIFYIGRYSQDYNIINLYLPDTITEIGAYTFTYLYGLREVQFPTNLKTIGTQAFYHSILIALNLSDTQVQTIGDQAFSSMVGLITLPITLQSSSQFLHSNYNVRPHCYNPNGQLIVGSYRSITIDNLTNAIRNLGNITNRLYYTGTIEELLNYLGSNNYLNFKVICRDGIYN